MSSRSVPHPQKLSLKFILSILLFVVSVSCLYGQSQVVVSGRIVEAPNKKPLGYTTITVRDGANKVIFANITDEKGRFAIKGLATGKYTVNATFVGFSSENVPFMVGAKNNILDLGDIELTVAENSIDEVVVMGQKQNISAALDKKSFMVADNITAAGGSVLDAMRNMPGITVDQQGSVVLRGSDKVAILIDGQQSGMTGFGSQKGLDNIPATAIERIEIINNPSAKYDASGMAGIVNIIYKKQNQAGVHADVGFSYGIGNLTTRKKDLPTGLPSYKNNNKYTPSLSLNYKRDRLNMFIQGNIIHQQRLPNNEFTTRTYDNGLSLASQVAENRKQNHYYVKGGFDWEINDRNTLSIFGVYDYEKHIDTSRIGYFDLSTKPLKSTRNWGFNETESTGLASITANHKYRFAEAGHQLTTSFQFTKGWEDEAYDLYEYTPTPGRTGQDRTHIIAPEYVYLLTIDYVKPLHWGRLEAGLGGRFRDMPIDYTVTQAPDSPMYPGLGDWSKWGENMISGYLNFVFEKPKFDVEAGLRAEQTYVLYEIAPASIYYPNKKKDRYNYLSLLPNVRFTYNLSSSNKLSLFYNRRIDRPGEGELRIFPKYDDPELFKIGNPYLRPQYTQNFEAAFKHLWSNGSLYVAAYHKIIDDYFTRIYSIDANPNPLPNQPDNVINKIYQNTGEATNTGLEMVFDQRFTRWWNFSASANWYRNKISAFTGVMYFPYEREFMLDKSADNTWYAKFNSVFTVAKATQIQISGQYFAPKNSVQGRDLERWSIDFGAKRTFNKGRIEVMFSANDIFNTMAVRQQINGDGFTAVYGNYYETQIFTLGLKYKF